MPETGSSSPLLCRRRCAPPRRNGNVSPLFKAFWGESQARPRSASGEYKGPSKGESPEQREGSSLFLDRPGNQSGAAEGNSKAVYGASAQQRLKKVDFSQLPCDDLALLEELSLRLLRRMSLRLSRRLAISNRATRIDLRRSIRRNITRGGEPFVLAYKGRKPRKNKLVILLDISGSMNFYSLFLVRFAYALQACFERVHTFLFSTNVVESQRPAANPVSARGAAEALPAGSGLVRRHKYRRIAPAV